MASATLEQPKTPAAELLALIGDQTMPVSDVLAVVSESVLAGAWARGEIQFGRRQHCVSGRPGLPESNPTLYVEDGMSWSGAKTAKHKRVAAVLADGRKVPECKTYRQYVRQVSKGKDEYGIEQWRTVDEVPDGVEYRWTTQPIDRERAAKLLELHVQLTDKGLAAMDAA